MVVMSAGLGTYVAIPGGGSVERRESSRVRRALVMGVNDMVDTVFTCDYVARGSAQMKLSDTYFFFMVAGDRDQC